MVTIERIEADSVWQEIGVLATHNFRYNNEIFLQVDECRDYHVTRWSGSPHPYEAYKLFVATFKSLKKPFLSTISLESSLRKVENTNLENFCKIARSEIFEDLGLRRLRIKMSLNFEYITLTYDTGPNPMSKEQRYVWDTEIQRFNFRTLPTFSVESTFNTASLTIPILHQVVPSFLNYNPGTIKVELEKILQRYNKI